MSTIDLTAIESDAVANYFASVGYDDLPRMESDLLTEQPVTCAYSFRDESGTIHRCDTRIVPWVDYCMECATGETCDHADADRIQGNGWTACAACGEIIG